MGQHLRPHIKVTDAGRIRERQVQKSGDNVKDIDVVSKGRSRWRVHPMRHCCAGPVLRSEAQSRLPVASMHLRQAPGVCAVQ